MTKTRIAKLNRDELTAILIDQLERAVRGTETTDLETLRSQVATMLAD